MIQKYDLSPICFQLMKYNLQVQLVSERSKYLRRKTVQMDLNTILVSILGRRTSRPGQYFLHFQNAGRQDATRETITGVHSLTEYSV